MGTRSLTHVKEDGKTIVTIYRQYDGYPTGIGADIKEILGKGKATIANGYGSNSKNPVVFNGMGCLAAYLVGALKHELYKEPQTDADKNLIGERNSIGNVYLYPPDSSDVGEEYTYTLNEVDGKLTLQVEAYGKVIYDGLLSKFNPKTVEKKVN